MQSQQRQRESTTSQRGKRRIVEEEEEDEEETTPTQVVQHSQSQRSQRNTVVDLDTRKEVRRAYRHLIDETQGINHFIQHYQMTNRPFLGPQLWTAFSDISF
jgi:hypothetical protein